ncbi:adenine deaminase [Bacilli bacterium PM5-3]|nr:adenine deaminase [Bacilli bacterium PM5-3]
MNKQYIEVANGSRMADLVLKNGNIINVFSEEIICKDIAIVNDTIVGIGEYQGKVEIDCSGKYLSPGFIDAHMHIESTMVTPLELAKKIIKKGTTTIIADPHEIVNVAGKTGLDYILDACKKSPINTYIMVPSCVPASDIDVNGAGEFSASDMQPYLSNPHILGLGEVMRYHDIINANENILSKIKLFSNRIIDGHAPRITQKEVQAYRVAGINNDHECESVDEALEKLRAGLNIYIREGSAAKNLDILLKGLLDAKVSLENCCFCTDDKHLADIDEKGHINYCIKKAIDLKTPIVKAFKMATYNTAKVLKIDNIGAIGAGYQADIIVLDSLDNFEPTMVIKGGQIVDDKFLNSFQEEKVNKTLLNSVVFNNISSSDLFVERFKKNHVIELCPYSIITKHLYETIPGENNVFIPNETYSKLCVVERYNKTKNISCCALKGYNIKDGAIATSVSHDSHNIIAVGDNDSDLSKAINELKKIQGGYVIVNNGKVTSLPLKIGGLMSLDNANNVQTITENMIALARKMNVSKSVDPFITLSFISLAVLPEIRLLEAGLYDVEKENFIKEK